MNWEFFIPFCLGLSFLVKFWPFLIPALVLGLTLTKRGGTWMLRFLRLLDRPFELVARPITWVCAAGWNPGDKQVILKLLRRAIFLVFCLGVLISAVLTRGLPQFIVVFSGYFVALCVVRNWISVEKRVFEGASEPNAEDIRKAAHLQRSALACVIVLVLLIPFTFQAAHRNFELYKVEDDHMETWAFFSLDLLFQAAADIDELLGISTAPEVAPKNNWGRLLIVFHFLVLAYVVMNAVPMLARRDLATSSAMQRLREDGDTKGIARFGERILPDLIALLQEPKAQHSPAAAEALGMIREANVGIEHKEAYDALIASLKDERWHVRKNAALALGTWKDPTAIKELLGSPSTTKEVGIGLHDSQAMVRWAAAKSLGQFGKGCETGVLSEEHVERLGDALADPATWVRGAAAEALSKAPKPTDPNSPVYSQLWDIYNDLDENPGVQTQAVEALKNFDDPGIEGQIHTEIEALRSASSPKAREDAANQLGNFPRDEAAVDALLARIGLEKEPKVLAEIVRSLSKSKVKGKKEEVSLAIQRTLARDVLVQVKRAAVVGLSAVGDEPAIIKALCESLLRDKKSVKDEAAEALSRADALAHPDPATVSMVVQTLKQVDPHYAVPVLRSYVEARQKEHTEGLLGQEASEVIADLLEGMPKEAASEFEEFLDRIDPDSHEVTEEDEEEQELINQ